MNDKKEARERVMDDLIERSRGGADKVDARQKKVMERVLERSGVREEEERKIVMAEIWRGY